jgi:phytol kinase
MITNVSWQDLLPTWPELFLLTPCFLLLSIVFFEVSALLKTKFKWRTGDSRKCFHTFVFLTAAMLSTLTSLSILCLFGFMVSSTIAFALFKADGFCWYEVMARTEDAPHRTRYILYPWLSTFLGGCVSQLISPSAAVAGFLVVGIGDALAEPVGIRWGRHIYRLRFLPWLRDAQRSLEGSAAVLISSWFIFYGLMEATGDEITFLFWVTLNAVLVTLVEALSPHGWDNFFLQVAGTYLLYLHF